MRSKPKAFVDILKVCSILLLLSLGACSSSSSSSGSGSGTDGDTSGSTSGGDDSGGGNTDGLGPLPNPPLSQPPGADDEPVAESGEFNTLPSISLVRDPGARIPEPEEVTLTEEDFAAGPLPAVVSTPSDVDPATNAPPYFENLEDQTITAGELLEVVFKPVDPEGDIPGMFPEELPPGATFDDNFDGSKTYRWQPLQVDVGINEFTVTAIDPANNQYRTTRTIRIKVLMPDDPSSIPNVAPVLDEFIPHTVRLGDPVVLELKGIDYNGSIPTLELVTALPGATFIQHPRYEEIFSLRFVPATVGELFIDILARDSVDTTLTSTDSVSLTVLPASAFAKSGQRLRDLAVARGIDIGYASLQTFYHRPDGGIYAATAAEEFNLVTPENSMKMDHLNPMPGRYQFADTDNLVTFAKANGMRLHAHPLVWYKQLPQWIQNAPADTLESHMREFIHRVMTRYKDDIKLWDVVNEPVGENGGFRNSVWFNAMGESYLDIAFKQARETAPDATLLLNEYDIGFNGPKADSLFSMLDGLIAREVPIDGVGFQMHVFSSFDQFDELRANFQKVADRGLDIYINELDVALVNGDSEETQADVYQQVVQACLDQPRCNSIQTWGFTDQYSFRKIFEPLMFDKDYAPKPAYNRMQQTLGN